MIHNRLASDVISGRFSMRHLLVLCFCLLPLANAISLQEYLNMNADPSIANSAVINSPVNPANKAIVEIDNAKEVAAFLQSLAQSIEDSRQGTNSMRKRGLDLGLSRGFSGSKVAKHLMGLASAQFANGPGKRR